MYYRIYGKHKDDKRFCALDLSTGAFVNNLMYATFFREEEKEKAQSIVKNLQENNKDFEFKIVATK